jgi:hypothetical protein
MAQDRDIRELVAAVRTWGRRMAREVAVLPDTLEKLRDGATNFQTVGKRLDASSSALEELTSLYGRTLGDAVRRSNSAAEVLQDRLAKLPQNTPPDLLAAAASDLQRTLDALASLNPFWPPPDRKPRKR